MRIKVDAKQAVITEHETLTVGSRGIMIGLEFSPEWDGLAKTALFWDGVGEPIPVLIFSDFVEIPAELTASNTLKPSVVFKGVASDGSVVYPAVECPLGSVWHGIRTGGYPAEPPTPDWTAQIEAAVREAVETANGVRSDADEGVFDGGYYTVVATATGDKLTFTWTASDPGMEAIPPQTVALDIPGASPEEIAKAVEAYLTEHPVQASVQSVNSKTGNVVLTAEDVQADPAGAAQAVADELRGEIAGIVVPTKLSELTDDTQHRTVTDAEKAEWSSKQPAGDYATSAELAQAVETQAAKDAQQDAAISGKQPAGDYLTEETDPTVPAWAKQPSKPTYTAEEVGALPDSTEALKNPNALTFTGAVSATYDGSKPVRVEIPVGGSGGPANASELAATVPAGLPAETAGTVQAVLEALAEKPSGGGSEWELVKSIKWNSNMEVHVESIDYDTNMITAASHGLSNDDVIYTVGMIQSNKTMNLGPLPIRRIPKGIVLGTKLYVINADISTFQISLTKAGPPVDLTPPDIVDFSAWHFEKQTTNICKISNMTVKTDLKIVYHGKGLYRQLAQTTQGEYSIANPGVEGENANIFDILVPTEFNTKQSGMATFKYLFSIASDTIETSGEASMCRIGNKYVGAARFNYAGVTPGNAAWNTLSKSYTWGANIIAPKLSPSLSLVYWSFPVANGFEFEVYTK